VQISETFNQGQNIGAIFLNFFIAELGINTSIKSFTPFYLSVGGFTARPERVISNSDLRV